MIRVQPVYKCLYCGAFIYGGIMELSDRPKKDLIVDVMDMAKPMFEPHHCKNASFTMAMESFHAIRNSPGAHGVVQYVGFNHIGQD
jgi:hypothetical protein